jgi:5-methyltetrahydrofolate--homocysteine methyltransferase
MHREVRLNHWGYASEEFLDNESLIQEKYRGIRPAPGYPACPDHLEKIGLFEMLDATKLTGVSLTETLAMLPAASVSGWYFAHEQSKYFGLGKINSEQLENIAKRKNDLVENLKKWYSSFLNDN